MLILLNLVLDIMGRKKEHEKVEFEVECMDNEFGGHRDCIAGGFVELCVYGA